MRGAIFKSIVILLVIVACQPTALAKENLIAGHMSNLDRAIAFAVYIEVHASRLSTKTDVCVGFGHGLAVDEKGILSELNRRNLKVHPNAWCNEGPRGLVISIIGPTTESSPATYGLMVEVGDMRPLQQGREHFAALLRRGTYIVRCKGDSEPELVRYQESPLPASP